MFEVCRVATRVNEVKSETGALTLTYQVIFATSFVVEELNRPEYTVGEFYTRENNATECEFQTFQVA